MADKPDKPEKEFIAGAMVERDTRPQRGPWAPGYYHNRCMECGELFVGDKLARMCAPCAYSKKIFKGQILFAKEHINDMPEGRMRSMGEVVRWDDKLGWFVVVDGNHSKWYRDEKEIEKDFDIPSDVVGS